MLNPADESDLFVLHRVFLPRINNALHEFALAWNLHPMRTMHNLSPKEYFTVVILMTPVQQVCRIQWTVYHWIHLYLMV